MSVKYYTTGKGYIATDSTVKLRANTSSVGNSLVFGRGPTVDWDLSSITDQVFSPQMLGIEVEAVSVPPEWQAALGLAPVKNSVKTEGLSHLSGSSDLPTHDVTEDREFKQTAKTYLTFFFGVFIGLLIAYYIL